ncbi:uncharacterized protein BT62DRAFT_924992 [Guyanagaster necrorhizus]|uniref:Uncharacterized protein n=1 Tax=Guyanagaster necrorhizus TaxID=856835 RepID=A0A9P8AY25_9AGAR|nr:uncharacterized protein BT62DRAFT_924992 [Guyanagaster necrorhizus MCA 3950]KAG7452434.1 hypothetical protein BT62DRAFT_924992 [Guyanagaster necrorhizus MCA 3950]
MPGDKGYTYTGSGTNSRGNHYCSRADSGTGKPSYHYSNTDGSYYYSNSNSSTYYNSGTGYSQYTSPGGNVTKSTGK